MKVELSDDVQTLTIEEVVEQLKSSGALEVGDGEYIGECRLECGCDLEVDITSCLVGSDRTETFTEEDIREHFTQGEWYAWAKDEDGNDILLCFN
ncbi:MAG: hypothetical protein IJI35_09780 [Kiritimatiellae bacterium]|nr:hypothetical protein [Kiritimatiellia bacterium]